MKISIDTKEDSPEEIKKAIRMLSSLVHEHEVYTNEGSRNIFEQPGSMQEPTNTFGSNEPTVTPASSGSEPSGNVFGNLFGDTPQQETPKIKPVEKDDMPEIMPYD